MRIKKLKQPSILKSEIEKIVRFQKGIKSDGYRPWLTVRNSNTHGQGQIIHSHLTDREHHLLSRGELKAFLYLERQSSSFNILEQIPLDIYETMAIAIEMGIMHPGAHKERHKYDGVIPAKTMSTDFLHITKGRNGAITKKAYNFKYTSSLDKSEKSPQSIKRTEDKMKIEAEYWHRKGIDRALVTEKCYDDNVVYNLQFLRECFESPLEIQVSDDFYAIVVCRLRHHFRTQPQNTLADLIAQVSEDCNISALQALCLFQHATYRFMFPMIDLSQRIELYRPLPIAIEELRHAS